MLTLEQADSILHYHREFLEICTRLTPRNDSIGWREPELDIWLKLAF
jgi:hypothetical protein